MEQSIFAQLAMRPEYGCASLLAVAPCSCSSATFNSIFGAIPQTAASEQHKRREREQHAGADSSVLAGILRAGMTARAEIAETRGDGGFDSTTPEPVLDKLRDEIDEVRAELTAGVDHARLQDEIGDVLFVGVNLARLTHIDYSAALRGANAKFERCFRRMETLVAADGRKLAGMNPVEQDPYWDRAKAEERSAG